MSRYTTVATAILALTTLTACGGGGGGGGYTGAVFADYTALQGDFVALGTQTPDAVVDAMSGPVTYNGIATMSRASGAGYLGDLSVTVNFTSDTFSGDVDNFGKWTDGSTPYTTPRSASGSVTFSGVLTGDNDSTVGGGMVGTGSGSIEGDAVTYAVDGHIAGDSAQGVALYFFEDGALAGGTGIAVD